MGPREIFGQINKDGRQVFSLLQKNGPLTKNGLLEILKTNFTALNRIMEPLEKEQLIVEAGIGESSGGRKPVLYDLNPKKFYILGIDISRPYTQLVIVNPKLDIIHKRQFAMDELFTPEATVRHIAKLFQEIITRLKIDQQLFLGAGLGTVGPLDRERGIMINPKNFAAPGWVGAPIKSMLEQEFGLPVLIDNGGNTAVLAEYFFGAGKGFQNIAYFNCSIGIRTGAISAGNIVRTINDAEDAFGHMVIDVDGERCGCGNYGCVECYASIHSIMRKFITALKKGRVSKVGKPLENIDYIDICRAAEMGDELARGIISDAATIFGAGLANFINLLNPRLVILSGRLVSHSDLFYRMCTDSAWQRLYFKTANGVIFSKGGHFGEDAIAVGAAVMVMEKHLRGNSFMEP